jgi:malate synthase
MTRISRGSLSLPSDLGDPSHNLFPTALTELLEVLHTKFEPQRQQLLKIVKTFKINGIKASSHNISQKIIRQRPDWKVAPVPKELTTRRVEITGPVSSSKMVINMLNRSEQGARADMAMMDFEDSMMPSWPNVLAGLYNAREAVKGTLELKTPTKNYKLNTDDMGLPNDSRSRTTSR